LAYIGGRGDTPLLSIVIPTRERAVYLSKCLDAAIACKDPRIEIVVSDNANKDNTASVVAGKRDARIRYVNTGRRVPVSDNLEFAFANAAGQYLLYCGDDDAILPGGMQALLNLLESERPDMVNWPQATFFWPDKDPEDGYLQLKRTNISGGVHEQDPRKMFAELCANGSHGPYFYWGCVTREIVNRVIDKAGRYFYHMDIGSSCYCNLAEARRFLHMGRPAFAFGQSPASTIKAMINFDLTPPDAGAGADAYSQFMCENTEQRLHPGIDVNNRCVWALAFDALLLTRRLLGYDEPPINAERWKYEMEREIGRMPEPLRSSQADIVDAYLAGQGVSRLNRNGKTWRPKKKRKRLRLAIPGLRVSHKNIRLGTRPGFMQDIAAAVKVADYIIGQPSLDASRGRAGDTMAWCGAVLRAANVRFGHDVGERDHFSSAGT
jgi:glycosyltransferase involved in cell wall biosynthesis